MSAPIREFDVSGVAAPFYVLRAKQVLDQMVVGQILALTTDAPHAPREIRSLVEHLGHQLVSGEAIGSGHRFMIRRL